MHMRKYWFGDEFLFIKWRIKSIGNNRPIAVVHMDHANGLIGVVVMLKGI